MFKTKVLDTTHKDVIHDISFDWYGKRMATCSTDQVIKIWNMSGKGTWEPNATIKSLSGSVWKVNWAHPEFGQIIATCSFDRSACIYEETVSEGGQGLTLQWKRVHQLVEARSAVMDIRFAPKALGLMLATCTADGMLRVYEAFDPMNLSQWTPTFSISTRLPSCSCLSWNPTLSRDSSSALLAVGSDDWFATGIAPTSSSNATCPRVLVFGQAEEKQWKQVAALQTVTAPVHDLAFAPNPGRAHHTLAIAGDDLRIVVLKQKQGEEDGLDLKLAGKFGDFGSTVWRVSWNVTGTVLTATGDNGAVRVYRANYLDTWKCVGSLDSSFTGGGATTREVDDSARPHTFSSTPSCTKPTRPSTKFFAVSPTVPTHHPETSHTNPSHYPWH